MCYGVQMSDDVARENKATADHRLTDLRNFILSLDTQLGQLDRASVSDALINDLTVCIEALKTALTSVALDKARQDITRAEKVIKTARAFIVENSDSPVGRQ